MKLTIDQSSDSADVEITIKCGIIDKHLEKLIAQIRLYSFSIIGKKDGQSFQVQLADVYYFESLEDRVFIYLKDDMFESDLRLYELEKSLSDSRFMRISKSVILNIEQLKSVRALLNGRYEGTLKNHEKVLISRHYVAGFKAKFLGEGG